MWPRRAYSKLVEVVSVADVSDEDRVGNSLFQIWKLRFGQKAKLFFRLWAQGLVFEVEVKARFEAGVWLVGCCWCFVKVMKLNLGQDSEGRGGQYFEFQFSRDADVWLRFWSWCLVKILKFDQDLCLNLWYELNPRVRCAFGNV